jgi:flagella basal body P-ring formation protein FlgA
MKRPSYLGGAYLGLVATLVTTPAAASPQDPAQVSSAIHQALAETAPANATITLGPVDGAKFMQSCQGALGVTLSGVEPYEQAAVHCPAPGWTLYVTVTIAATQPVVVAARPIAAGQVFSPSDFTIAREPVSLYAGRQVFYDSAALTGASAVMNLPAGAIVTGSDIAEPVAVTAGQTVSVSVVAGGVIVSLSAVADQTGRVGDTILMTNPTTGQHFPAQVTSTGIVVTLQ